MMLLGYNTNGFAHHRLEDALHILAELGYQSVAITLDHHALNPFNIHTDLPPQLATVSRILKEHHLCCVIETGARYLLDPKRKHQPTLLSDAQEGRQRRMDFLVGAMSICQLLKADVVSFWSGTPSPEMAEETCWRLLVEGCRRLAERAAEMDVWLAFEPEPGMFIDTMPKFAELHRRVNHPRFGLTLDVGHLHCMGETPIAPHIERYADCLWNVHIEDMRDGVHDHLMFGDGDMDFPPILRALESIGYSGGVHVELSRHSHDAVNTARKAISFLRDL